ncbi:MAG: hypothetical protein ABFS37_16275, partial [Acidobacteriota bacterium]
MSGTARGTGLRTIFSIFLGMMLNAFIGIGAYTFHPPPKEFDQEIRKLNQREQEIREAGQSDEWTAEER